MKKLYIIFCAILCLFLCGCSKKELKFENLLSYNSIDEIKTTKNIECKEWGTSGILINNIKYDSYTGIVIINNDDKNKLSFQWKYRFSSKDELKKNENKINKIISSMSQEYGEPDKQELSNTNQVYYFWHDILNNLYAIELWYTNTPDFTITYTKQI